MNKPNNAEPKAKGRIRKTRYEKPSVVVRKLEEIVQAGGASGTDFLMTPNSRF